MEAVKLVAVHAEEPVVQDRAARVGEARVEARVAEARAVERAAVEKEGVKVGVLVVEMVAVAMVAGTEEGTAAAATVAAMVEVELEGKEVAWAALATRVASGAPQVAVVHCLHKYIGNMCRTANRDPQHAR
jgi:hypothetical protein